MRASAWVMYTAGGGDSDRLSLATFADPVFFPLPFEFPFDCFHFGPFPSAPPPLAQQWSTVWPGLLQFEHVGPSVPFESGFEKNSFNFELLLNIRAFSWSCLRTISCSKSASMVAWRENFPVLFRMMSRMVFHSDRRAVRTAIV